MTLGYRPHLSTSGAQKVAPVSESVITRWLSRSSPRSPTRGGPRDRFGDAVTPHQPFLIRPLRQFQPNVGRRSGSPLEPVSPAAGCRSDRLHPQADCRKLQRGEYGRQPRRYQTDTRFGPLPATATAAGWQRKRAAARPGLLWGGLPRDLHARDHEGARESRARVLSAHLRRRRQSFFARSDGARLLRGARAEKPPRTATRPSSSSTSSPVPRRAASTASASRNPSPATRLRTACASSGSSAARSCGCWPA